MAYSILRRFPDVNLIITGPPQTGKKSFIRALSNHTIMIPESIEDMAGVYDLSFQVYRRTILVSVWYVRSLGASIEKIKHVCSNPHSNSVIVFWYALDAPGSLESLARDYIMTLRQRGQFHFLSLLVGNKADLKLSCFSPEDEGMQGKLIKASFHLGGFIECSTRNEQSVKSVFHKAIFIALGLPEE